MNDAGAGNGADILTIDFEDWYHILDSPFAKPATWNSLVPHIETDTKLLLDFLDRFSARATFFVVGWLAERTPRLVQEVSRRGHSLGTHGYHHIPPCRMSEEEFRNDLDESIRVIEDVAGVRARGYRAPGFGVRGCCFPYLRILQEFDLEYDASQFPGFLPGRGLNGGKIRPRAPAPRSRAFSEIRVSTVTFLGIPIAFSGGGFLRLLPSWFVQMGARKVRSNGGPIVCYLHPRDLNPRSPTVPASLWNRWRYYGGRRSVCSKLESILSSGRFISIEEYLDQANEPELA